MITVGLCQINPWVGNLSYNLEKIIAFLNQCQNQKVDLAVFPECALSGYPLEDLVLKADFLQKVEQTVQKLSAFAQKYQVAIVLGAPWLQDGKILNSALVLNEGKIERVIPKYQLPNYGVFDEKRVFQTSSLNDPIVFNGLTLGVMICEDMWFPDSAKYLKAQGAEVLIILNGSPFDGQKHTQRLKQARDRVEETKLPLIYVNLVGGQDHLVFDGRSFVMNREGDIICQMSAFQEEVCLVNLLKADQEVKLIPAFQAPSLDSPSELALLYGALVQGVRDYMFKNNFKKVFIGLSGGIDSALVAAIAVDALGAEKVNCIMMPSPYTSPTSLEDAQAIVKSLNTPYDSIGIESIMQAYDDTLRSRFKDLSADITEENIQSRVRGMILMALSNKHGGIVLTTGNKSEMAVGYATLYGDMCGGYNPLKDVYKTQVFALSRWRNSHWQETFLGPKGAVMPERVIIKPPSAELKPNQKDQDSLPDYNELDQILQGLVEEDLSVEEIIKRGFVPADVKRVAKLLDRAEYKRKQAPPGPKTTSCAFSVERRYPITNGFDSNEFKSN